MLDLVMIVEDAGQEALMRPLVSRMAREAGVEVAVRMRSARGGYAKVVGQLEDLEKDCTRGKNVDLVLHPEQAGEIERRQNRLRLFAFRDQHPDRRVGIDMFQYLRHR